MADYIERRKIYTAVSKLLPDCESPILLSSYEQGREFAVNEALDIIGNAHAADVRPKKHGKWIVREVGDFIPFVYHPDEKYECSVCHTAFNVTSSYCPNCGSKMDGKDGKSNEN